MDKIIGFSRRLNRLWRKYVTVSRGALLALVIAAAWPAYGERVTGRFKYLDINPENQETTLRPIAHARVEVWRKIPKPGGMGAWQRAKVVQTDARGAINVTLPFAAKGAVIRVLVFAQNYAAVVWSKDTTSPFSCAVGTDKGAQLLRKVNWATDVLDFSANFIGESAEHFNLAEVVRVGYDYAKARRDPRERDVLPRAKVMPASNTPYGRSYYHYENGTLVIVGWEVYADFLVLHEYGHFLQHHISQFAPIYAYHDGCAATDANGQVVNSPEHAWMEGFANYFAGAVAMRTPAGTLHGWGSTFPPWLMENQPSPCPQVLAEFPPESIEAYVTGALWDLADITGEWGMSEDFDRSEGRDIGVFRIFDHEMDTPGVWPTITRFRHAWITRGLPREEIDAIWQSLGFATP